MPVILRLCVAIQRAVPRPPPTSILANADATTRPVAAVSSPSPTTSMAAHTASPAGAQEPTAAEPQSSSAVATGIDAGQGRGKAEKGTTASASPSGHRPSRLNPLTWLKSLGNKKKKQGSTATPTPTTATPHDASPATAASAATTAASPETPAAAPPGDASQPPSEHHHAQRRASAPAVDSLASTQRPLVACQPALSPHQDDNANRSHTDENEAREKGAEEEQRSLVWLSIQLTPATTVKAVVQQVQDMVERRMGAKLCEHAHAGLFSTSTTPAGSFAMAPQRAGREKETKEAPTHTVKIVSPTSRDAPEATEWCLCLQDGEGTFHWVGDTRHYPKSAVLRAPFVTEVCLQSHAAFEAQRQQQQDEAHAYRKAQRRKSAGGSSLRASFATAGGSPTLENLGASSTGSSSTVVGASSSLETSEGEREEGHAGGRHHQPHLPPHRHRRSHSQVAAAAHTSSENALKSNKGNKKKSGKGEHKEGRKANAVEASAKPRKVAMTASKFSSPSTNEVKFAFVKGVVVSAAVLKLRNPSFALRRRKPPLYIEVRVPREMRAEPLDPTAITTTSTAAAAAHPTLRFQTSPTHEVEGKASAPAAASPSSAAAKGSVGSVSDTHNPQAGASFSKDEDVDVDGPADPESGSVRAKSSSFATSASTMQSRSPPPDHDLRELGNYPQAGDALLTRVEECEIIDAGAELPMGLATHATPLEQTDDGDVVVGKPSWCRTADAARVKGVNGALLGQLTKAEDAARSDLDKAQRDYLAALAAHRAAVPPTPASMHNRIDTSDNEMVQSPSAPLPNANADAELASLLRRKLELQAAVEESRQAERQCARLTTLVECLERELREHDERRVWLTERTSEGAEQASRSAIAT